MKANWNYLLGTIVLIIAFGLISTPGCGKHDNDHDHDHAKPEVTSVKSEEMGHSHEPAAAGHVAPNGGHVVGIGAHAAHMEVVHHCDNGDIALYFTDATQENPVHPDKPVMLNLKINGVPKQFTMKASDDPATYVLEAPELKQHVIEGQVVVTIGGKEYFVALPEHDHDHDHGEEPEKGHDDDHDHDHASDSDEGEGHDHDNESGDHEHDHGK